MNRKMQGFLLSLGLEDIFRFDMDFTLVAKDEYTPNKINMMVEKDSLWDYELLDEFLLALGKVQYNYSIRFFYPNCTLTSKDVFELLDAWYPRNYFMPIRFHVDTSDPKRLVAVFSSEQQRDQNISRIGEFKEFLKFINYSMAFELLVDPSLIDRLNNRHPVLSEEDEKEIENEILEDKKEAEILAAAAAAQAQEEAEEAAEENEPAPEDDVAYIPFEEECQSEEEALEGTEEALSDEESDEDAEDSVDEPEEDEDVDEESFEEDAESEEVEEESAEESEESEEESLEESDDRLSAEEEEIETEAEDAENPDDVEMEEGVEEATEEDRPLEEEPEPNEEEPIEEVPSVKFEEAHFGEPAPVESPSMEMEENKAFEGENSENPCNSPVNESESEEEEEELIPLEDYDAAPEEEEDTYANMDGNEAIAFDRQKSIDEGEAFLLEEMQRNQLEWEQARERKELFRRGDYEVVESITELLTKEKTSKIDFAATIFSVDPRLTRKGKQMNKIAVADDSNAVAVTVFTGGNLKDDDVASLSVGAYVRIRGAVDYDPYSNQKTVLCHYLNILPAKPLRSDSCEQPRVELHLHTKMSTMDGVSEMKDYVKVAKSLGMKSIAVTDHGSLQSLPACQEACKKAGLKPIYGVETYMVDLTQKIISNPADIPLAHARFCVFDTETTGLVPRFDRVVEFGGLIVQNGEVLRSYNVYMNPQIPMTPGSSAINHITDDMLVDKPLEEEVLPEILKMFEGCILVAHNATFDMGFINAMLERHGYPPLSNPVVDTLALSHYLFPEKARHNEEAMLKNLGLNVYSRSDAHEAIYDATRLNEGWQAILALLEQKKAGITHADLASLSIDPPDKSLKESDPALYEKQFHVFNSYVGHLREKHTTVLVKNAQGLRSINKVISLGETIYLSGSPSLLPRTPRSLLEKYREDFLIGSSCQNGEIFDLAQSESAKELAKAMAFYDYIEIQPLSCYSNLLNMGEIRSEEQLKEILLNMIEAAAIANKPVVATGDCHYANPEDKIIRDVYITAKSIGNRDHPLWRKRRDTMPWFENPDQHLRSTTEMLADFAWLGEEKAKEIVVTNSNWVADQITTEPVPVSDDTFTPNQNIPHSDEVLREMCEKNFQERYGGNPDPEVQARLEEVHQRLLAELSGIIDHGYAVTYIIAHHLIRMAAEEKERYIVGSRGSVGSSFAATMADITEVNPLAPHYLCPKCHYFEWGDAKRYKSGFDLPVKECPHCHTKLNSDGQNIPFQTFLGFNAEKVPDIDLNFEDESQKKAHNYTKILLGPDKVFRAGTIETVAEKTAFGFVKQFFRIRGDNPDSITPQWVNYLSSRVQGVKRTTGQHPGGIVVVPKEYDVTDFTAYQHPADDLNSEWLTTHYDYHAMHDELLKLDILGHVDPMAMRYYRDITGVPIESIPMNDPRVLSLFTSPNELNLHENFLNLKTGVSAIPEFGTRLAQQMLTTANPKCFNDLLIISGLAHGTDVWSGNAEDLIVSGTTDINGVIGCRDDIMTYLISMGIENAMAFKIMEDVRKGKGKFRAAEDKYVPLMQAHHIPDWYIDSCRKIKYLFPRGHATAYVMMAVRVAWFKLYRPLEFYSVFFSIRSDAWDIKTMIDGEEAIKTRIVELEGRRQSRDNPLSNKEADILKTLQIALEMVERGYYFAPMDLYRSDGKMFVPDHERGCLIPPFSVIDNLGVNAGNSVVEARKDGKRFLSKEDLLSRTKLTRTNVEALIEIGGIEPLSDTNQISLFDFFD